MDNFLNRLGRDQETRKLVNEAEEGLKEAIAVERDPLQIIDALTARVAAEPLKSHAPLSRIVRGAISDIHTETARGDMEIFMYKAPEDISPQEQLVEGAHQRVLDNSNRVLDTFADFLNILAERIEELEKSQKHDSKKTDIRALILNDLVAIKRTAYKQTSTVEDLITEARDPQ